MKICLYTIGCPRCLILEKKLEEAKIPYDIITDEKTIAQENITIVPVLKIDNKLYDFAESIKWIKEQKEKNGN